jgi:transposase
VPTGPALLIAWLCRRAEADKRIGLEAYPLSDRLHDERAAAGLPVVCLETHPLRARLAAMAPRTDRNARHYGANSPHAGCHLTP